MSDYIVALISGDLSPSQGRTLFSIQEERKKYLDKLLAKEVNIRDVEKSKIKKMKSSDIFIADVCEKTMSF